MRALNLVPATVNLQFIVLKKLFFAISIAVAVASIGLYITKGLNYGIDFKGGILIEMRAPQAVDISAMRADLEALGLGEITLQTFGGPRDVLIRIQKQEGHETAQQAAVEAVKAALDSSGSSGAGIEYRRTEFVGPKISEELFWDGIMAVALALGAMLVYIWLRFEWQFGVGAIIALAHDVTATIGVFSLLGLEFNLSTVAAVLTIAGYSINDTVVIYDRVRENLRKYKTKPLPLLLNESINQTLSRTVMTSVTTLIALLSLYILGGSVISDFSFAMIFGVIAGTYSSACLAVPLLLHLKLDRNASDDRETKAAAEA